MRLVVLVLGLALALPGGAAPKELHAPCGKQQRCPTGLECLQNAAGVSTCELACRLDRPVCPEDHRCVKDGPRTVCRPIQIGDPGL